MSTVLCVDSDHHFCQILEKTLTRDGHRVLVAHDGESALTLIDERPPDLVILDILLPKRDGFEVLEEIRGDLNRHTPVLLTSDCRPTPQYRERSNALGAEALLVKPLPLKVLRNLVSKHLKGGASRGVTEAAKPPKSAAGAGSGKKSRQAAAAGGAAVSTKRKGAGKTAAGNARPRAAQRRMGNDPRGLSGTFDELPFPHLLHHLHGLRGTGVLLLRAGKKRKAVQLREGYPVKVKSNLITECLGNYLVRQGSLSQEVLDESIRRMKKGEGLQGQILVAMQILHEDEVVEALRRQAEEKLFEIFGWKRGEFRFELGGRIKRGNSLALEASPAHLILEGVRRRLPLEKVEGFFQDRGHAFVVAGESPFYRFQDVDLSIDEEALLIQIDEKTRLADLAGADERLRRTLYALVVTEFLKLRGDAPGPAAKLPKLPSESKSRNPRPPRGAESDRELRSDLASTVGRLRRQNYFEMLGVRANSSDAAVRQAHEDLATRLHPDRFSNSSSAIRQLADEAFQLLSRAQEVLGDVRGRQGYELELKKGQRRSRDQERGRRALRAETEFQKGEALMRQRDYESALACFGTALEVYPEEGEYFAHYGWCLYLCHPDNSVMIEEAIEHVKRGLKLARDREKPYLFLGRLYKVVGKNSAAERMFTSAVQIRPDCVEALRELRLINLRREKNKGLLGKLFRR